MSKDGQDLELRLDRYFSGEAGPEERHLLECEHAEELRAEVLLRERMGEVFAVPEPVLPDFGGLSGGGSSGGERGSWAARVWRWAGLGGAGLVLLGIIVWQFGWFGWGVGGSVDGELARAYGRERGAGFVPQVVETVANELSWQISSKLGRPVTIGGGDAGVRWRGFSPASGEGVGTPLRLALLAEVDGRDVLLLVDVVGSKQVVGQAVGGEREELGGGLRAFRRRVGGLVLEEVTPLGAARLLPLIGVGDKG